MEKDECRKYESIDALIMAAEVLEQAETLAKEQLGLRDNYEISNGCFTDLTSSKEKCDICNKLDSYNENMTKDQLTNDLIQTIYYIEDLRSAEKWTELLESKRRSDNRILLRELNDLKQKLNTIKRIPDKPNKAAPDIKHEDDEDTSTASEDEDHNKYVSLNIDDNVDDVTDDASECEETSSIPSLKLRLQMSDPISNRLFTEASTKGRPLNRKRKLHHDRRHSSSSYKTRPRPLCLGDGVHRSASSNIAPSLPSLFTLGHNPLPKVHQPVDT